MSSVMYKGGGAGTSQDVVNQIVNTVKQDMESWEKSGQWVFSCYRYCTECPKKTRILK